MHIAFQSPYPLRHRVGRYVADQPGFAGIFALLSDVPEAEVYLVGGTVRDAILGRVPADNHVVISGLDEGRFARWKRDQLARGARDFDIRRLSTHSIEGDLAARDVTFNSLAYRVRDGQFIDPLHGLDDLTRGVVRLNSSTRIHQEPLRALRALRFGAHTGFTHEPATWEAITRAVPHLNDIVSDHEGRAVYAHPRHALGQELLLGLHHHPAETFSLFTRSGATTLLLPELDANDDHVIYDQLMHLQKASLSAKLVGLFLTLEDQLATVLERVALRLHLHAATHKQAFLARTHLHALAHTVTRLHNEHPHTWSAHEREHLLTGNHADELFTLLQAKSGQSEACHDHVVHAQAARVFADRLASKPTTPALLHMQDLVRLGLRKGPHMRFLLRDVRSAQLDGRISTMDEAVQWVLREAA